MMRRRRTAMKKLILWLDNDRHFRWVLLLADLNCCAPSDIRAILAQAGDLLLGLFADYLTERPGEADHGT